MADTWAAEHAASTMAVSADGKQVAVGGNRAITIWDAQTGQLLQSIVHPCAIIFSLDWHPKCRTLATGHSNGEIAIWDVNSGKAVKRLHRAHSSWVSRVAWSPDGCVLASSEGGDNLGSLKLWTTQEWTLVQTLFEGRSGTNGFAWHPQGKLLATAHASGDIRIWDIESGEM